MKAQKKQITSAAALFLVFCLVGCGAEHSALQYFAEEDTAGSAETEEDMESIAGENACEQNIIKTNVVSNIYIDTQGYDTQDNKQVYLESDSLSPEQEFYVYEKDSANLVYTGKMVRTKGDSLSDETVYRGDFSDVTQTGAYYIQIDVIGRSHDFVIEDNHYDMILEKLRQSFLQTGAEEYYASAEGTGLTEGLYGFLQMSIACQLAPEHFDDEMVQKLCEHAKWLLEWKDEADEQKLQLSAQEYYLLSTCFAQFSVPIKQTDAQLSNQCLKAARRTYDQVTQALFSEGDNETARYMAAAALYKAAGNSSYHTVIKSSYKNRENTALQTEGDTVSGNTLSGDTAKTWRETFDFAKETQRRAYQNFLADFFYMTTEKTTDFNMCGQMMSDFMSECTDYLNNAANSAFGLTTGSEWPEGILPDELGQTASWDALRREAILQHGIQLAVADYAIVGMEYRNVCKQQLHYLMNNTDITDLPKNSQSAVWLILSIITGSEES